MLEFGVGPRKIGRLLGYSDEFGFNFCSILIFRTSWVLAIVLSNTIFNTLVFLHVLFISFLKLKKSIDKEG